MLQSLRLFKSIGGVLSDLSIENQEKGSYFLPELSSTNYLYIAQPHPFNNFHVWKKVANDSVAKIKVEYWDGTIWRSMVDVIDVTSIGGKTLARSGVVIFTPDPDKQWEAIDKSEKVSELSTLKIYDSYWLRVSTDNPINVNSSIEELSFCFAKSDSIADLDFEVEQYKEAFYEGKTDWTEELMLASKIVIDDLKKHNVIKDRGQLIKIEELALPTSYRALMVIYKHLGKSFLDKLSDTRKDYDRSLSFGNFTVDKNKNANIDEEEKNQRQNRLIR